MKPSGAVAEGATGNVSEEMFELSLRYDPLLGDDLKELKVKVRERGETSGVTGSATLPRHLDHQTDDIQG